MNRGFILCLITSTYIVCRLIVEYHYHWMIVYEFMYFLGHLVYINIGLLVVNVKGKMIHVINDYFMYRYIIFETQSRTLSKGTQ